MSRGYEWCGGAGGRDLGRRPEITSRTLPLCLRLRKQCHHQWHQCNNSVPCYSIQSPYRSVYFAIQVKSEYGGSWLRSCQSRRHHPKRFAGSFAHKVQLPFSPTTDLAYFLEADITLYSSRKRLTSRTYPVPDILVFGTPIIHHLEIC